MALSTLINERRRGAFVLVINAAGHERAPIRYDKCATGGRAMFYERCAIGGPHVGGFYASHKPVHLHLADARVRASAIALISEGRGQASSDDLIQVTLTSASPKEL